MLVACVCGGRVRAGDGKRKIGAAEDFDGRGPKAELIEAHIVGRLARRGKTADAHLRHTARRGEIGAAEESRGAPGVEVGHDERRKSADAHSSERAEGRHCSRHRRERRFKKPGDFIELPKENQSVVPDALRLLLGHLMRLLISDLKENMPSRCPSAHVRASTPSRYPKAQGCDAAARASRLAEAKRPWCRHPAPRENRH